MGDRFHARSAVLHFLRVYGSLSKEVTKSKFLPGRAWRWGWRRMTTFEQMSGKCPGMKQLVFIRRQMSSLDREF